MSSVNINTPDGPGEIESIFVSELGYLMIRVFLSKENRWITYSLGAHNEKDNIFTNSINK